MVFLQPYLPSELEYELRFGVVIPELTMEYLKNNQLEDFTYNKTLQKITESLRVDKETKDLIRGMKRK